MCLDLPKIEERTLARGEHLGFAWQVVHNDLGYRCGYVRIAPGHPWFGRCDLDETDALNVEVHGGITYVGAGRACETHGAEEEWWIGFDTAHADDAPDFDLPMEAGREHFQRLFLFPGATVRTTAYVRAECESLCEQARQACLAAA